MRIPTRTVVPDHGDIGCSSLGLPWGAPRQGRGRGCRWRKTAGCPPCRTACITPGNEDLPLLWPSLSLWEGTLATSPPCLISSPHSDSCVIMNTRSPSLDLVPGNYFNKCLLRYARTGRMPGNTRAHLDVPNGGPPESRGGPALEPSSLWARSAARLQLPPLKSL